MKLLPAGTNFSIVSGRWSVEIPANTSVRCGSDPGGTGPGPGNTTLDVTASALAKGGCGSTLNTTCSMKLLPAGTNFSIVNGRWSVEIPANTSVRCGSDPGGTGPGPGNTTLDV